MKRAYNYLIQSQNAAEAELRKDVDVEAAKNAWLAQYTHKGCGGSLHAAGDHITCQSCGWKVAWVGSLGDTVERTKLIVSIVC